MSGQCRMPYDRRMYRAAVQTCNLRMPTCGPGYSASCLRYQILADRRGGLLGMHWRFRRSIVVEYGRKASGLHTWST